MQIYTSQGYTERDAAQKIVENNLYGLELDDRAAQLAYFAVMMKARSYDRRFLGRGIRPNLCSIQESNNINPDYLELFGELKETARKLYDEFIDAKEYGSILNLKITADELTQIEERCNEIIDKNKVYDNIFDTIRQAGIRTDFPALIRQAKIMVQKHSVVCTNPPYMGGGYSPKLDAYIKKYYADSKSDLFAVFIEKCGAFAKNDGYYAMITQHAWMFLSSYEKLRKKLQNITTVNMAHLGARAFDEINGEVVQTTAFVNRNKHIKDYLGTYARLIDGKSENEKSTMFLSGKYNYTANSDNFSKIPGSPVAYWVSENLFKIFSNNGIEKSFIPKFGMSCGDSERFIRFWFEVGLKDISFDCSNQDDYLRSNTKWNVLDKGGAFRRWYGNKNNIVLWKNNGLEIKNNPKSAVRSPHLFFLPHISWTLISTNSFSARYFDKGFVLDTASNCLYLNNKDYKNLLALLNCKVTNQILRILNPTMNFSCGVIGQIPYININNNEIINNLVEENISLSKADWDSFETSWDFERHPLV